MAASHCHTWPVPSDHGSTGGEPHGRTAARRARRRPGAHHVRQRGERLHGRPGRHRQRRRRPPHRRRRAARRPGRRVPADGGPLGLPPAVRQAVHRGELHDHAARHRPGHPPLPRLGPGQGHRPRLRRPHHPALRPGHPADHRGGAQAAHRGARPRPQAHQEDRRRLGGAEGDQGGHALPPDRRGVHLHRRAHLQEVRRRLDLRRQEPAVPARRPTSGASASSPPTRSPSPSASRTTARSASRRACSTRCRSPPTRATAISPRSG